MVNDESKQDIEALQFETDFERRLKAASCKLSHNTDDVYECWDDESFEVIDNSLHGNVARDFVDILDDLEIAFRDLVDTFGLDENYKSLGIKTSLKVRIMAPRRFGSLEPCSIGKGCVYFDLSNPKECKLYHEVQKYFGPNGPIIEGYGIPAVEKVLNNYKRYLESKGESK